MKHDPSELGVADEAGGHHAFREALMWDACLMQAREVDSGVYQEVDRICVVWLLAQIELEVELPDRVLVD